LLELSLVLVLCFLQITDFDLLFVDNSSQFSVFVLKGISFVANCIKSLFVEGLQGLIKLLKLIIFLLKSGRLGRVLSGFMLEEIVFGLMLDQSGLQFLDVKRLGFKDSPKRIISGVHLGVLRYYGGCFCLYFIYL
jgi:hypothetical protein